MVDSMDVESLAERARAFKALGEPTRLRILAHLRAGERCACEVQQALELPANLLSHHLKVLREAGLVVGTRRGRWIDYRLEPDRLARLAAVLAAAADPPSACDRAAAAERTVAA